MGENVKSVHIYIYIYILKTDSFCSIPEINTACKSTIFQQKI